MAHAQIGISGNSSGQHLHFDLMNPPLMVANSPETRIYRMSFRDGGEANGDWTDVVKVTVGGVDFVCVNGDVRVEGGSHV